ncbi:hypothetical protein PInf_017657 [Phytophthora infestans]|nr:hypothetical protein PInf_017657 [Phytophthora infestans]
MARIRSENRTRTDAVAAAIKSSGWKYKRSKGIQTKGKYVSADESKVLVGEEAVVAYSLETGLLDDGAIVDEGNGADQETVAPEKTTADIDRTPAAAPSAAEKTTSAAALDADKTVATADEISAASVTKTAVSAKKTTSAAASAADKTTASADETSAASATKTTVAAEKTAASVNETLAAADDNSNNTSDAFDDVRASQIDTSAELSQTLCGCPAFWLSNLQLLSEVSGAESDTQTDTVPTAQHDSVPAARPANARGTRPVSVPETPSTRGLRSRCSVKKDVNFISDDEDLSEYESFSSGESDDDIDADNDDDGIDDCDEPEDDDELSEDDAVPMDAAFIESLQQLDDALRAMQ